MKQFRTKIHDPLLLKPEMFRDEQGFCLESWSRKTFVAAGLDLDFVQENRSRSAKHALRGLYYQAGAAAQGSWSE